MADIQEPGYFDLVGLPSFRASKLFLSTWQMGKRGQTRHTSFITMSVYNWYVTLYEQSSTSELVTWPQVDWWGYMGRMENVISGRTVHSSHLVHTTGNRRCIFGGWLTISAEQYDLFSYTWKSSTREDMKNKYVTKFFSSLLFCTFCGLTKIAKENLKSKCKSCLLESIKMDTNWNRRWYPTICFSVTDYKKGIW